MIEPLIEQCREHIAENIKYYCKECKQGICPECVLNHARHDFIAANELAAIEVK